jgi:hypothetical protein
MPSTHHGYNNTYKTDSIHQMLSEEQEKDAPHNEERL